MKLMEKILSNDNVTEVLKYLENKKKNTAPGVDGMIVPELRDYLRDNWRQLKPALLKGTYQPQSVKRTEIPKDSGGMRKLGIPTVLDRFIQQSMLKILYPLIDKDFSIHSHGFRKGHSQHMAVRESRAYMQDGYEWIVDMDISKFFDRVNHDILMSKLAKKIKDKAVLKLVRSYLEAGVMVDGVVVETHKGTPQGGPLSPLLSNLMLDELDKELERRGHKFVRYADDLQVYVRSERAGKRVMKSLINFLEDRLKLKVNEQKSAIVRIWECNYLGFSFYTRKGEVRFRLPDKSFNKIKQKIRKVTSRSNPLSTDKRIKKLNEKLQGWLGYFYMADMKGKLKGLMSWMRRRLRMCILKQWKKVKTRIRKLRGFGLSDEDAIAFANSRKGYWKLSLTETMHTIFNNDYWKDRGLIDLVETYLGYR